MHIRDYKYTAEDVDCRYCTEFHHGRCGAIKCPWLNERIEAGVISYHDAVNESFSSRSPLLRRIRLVLTFYDKSFWKDDDHFRRFQQADAILSFYKMQLTKIQSLPIIGCEWQYLFYVDVTYDDLIRYRQAIDAITPLTKELTILGEYKAV